MLCVNVACLLCANCVAVVSACDKYMLRSVFVYREFILWLVCVYVMMTPCGICVCVCYVCIVCILYVYYVYIVSVVCKCVFMVCIL